MKAAALRFNALPRVVKWLVCFVVAIGAYFGAVEPYLGVVIGMRTQADDLENRHRERAALAGRLESSKSAFNSSVIAYGAPKFARSGDAVAELDRRVSTVLAAHNAIEKRRSAKDATPISMGQIASGGSGKERKLERAGLEVSFECETSELVLILKDLESSPEISAIGRMEIRKLGEIDKKTGAGYIAVTLAPEVWTFSKDGATSPEPGPAKEPVKDPEEQS